MNTRRFDRFVGYARGGGFMLLTLLLAMSATAQTAGSRWQQADALEQQGRFLDAGEAYAAILGAEPQSQQAAVKRAVCQYEAGQAVEAVDGLERAVEMAPFAGWAGMGLYYHALACRDAGCPDVTRDCIVRLKAHFPDAAWTTRAEAIEAQLDGLDTVAAEKAVARELEADGVYKQALAAAAAKDYPGALQFLDTVISAYPDTRTVLRAMESTAFILAATPQGSEEALDTFQGIVDSVASTTPDSRISYEAQYRVAALHQRQHRKQEAAEQYSLLAARAIDPAVKSNAHVQAAGARMELLFQRHRGGQVNQPADWEQVRAECRQIKELGIAKPRELARAELMIVESFAWELATEETLAAAKEYLATHDAETYPSEVATAHLLYGEFLQRKGQHSEALPHYRWITERFGEKEAWPGLTITQRAYYRVYDALRSGGSPREEVKVAAQFVLTRWPDSTYARLIGKATEQENR